MFKGSVNETARAYLICAAALLVFIFIIRMLFFKDDSFDETKVADNVDENTNCVAVVNGECLQQQDLAISTIKPIEPKIYSLQSSSIEFHRIDDLGNSVKP